MQSTRIIRVTGKGTIKAKPDMTRIQIKLTGHSMEYEKSLEQSAEDTEILKDILIKHGFEREEVKTHSFGIEAKHESYRKKDGTWDTRFVGYVFAHELKVEFDSDNNRLGKILFSLGHAKKIMPEIRFSYFVKDQESAKNILLAKAIEDATSKATVLSSAAGIALNSIQMIDYSWGKVELEVSPLTRNLIEDDGYCASEEMDSYNLDIEPEDIEVSDTVTVVWEIA